MKKSARLCERTRLETLTTQNYQLPLTLCALRPEPFAFYFFPKSTQSTQSSHNPQQTTHNLQKLELYFPIIRKTFTHLLHSPMALLNPA